MIDSVTLPPLPFVWHTAMTVRIQPDDAPRFKRILTTLDRCPSDQKTSQSGKSVTDGQSFNQDTGNRVLWRVMKNHKTGLKMLFENISECIIQPGAETLLNKIYTELHITIGESEGVKKEHEVWQIESASKAHSTENRQVSCNDIFKALSGQKKRIRTVMTKGVAGIGKTVSVQKFILDWLDGIANPNVDFIFPLSFCDLNLIKDNQYSLHSLLLDFHPELKGLKNCEEYKDHQVLFIFDGLDESRFMLKFQPNTLVSDVQQTSSVDVLITSLIQGTLLPSALIWITSRPAAANQIPAQYIGRFTEIQGFNSASKEEYFRKRITDENQANKIISHIKASKTIYAMSRVPAFSWIATTVLQQMIEQGNSQPIPETLTEMFIRLLLIQICKGRNETDKESQQETILKLAKLAFKNLEKGNGLFYEDDLRECGIDANKASEYSGMCSMIFKEESVFQQRKVYCFVHLSIQEFLAALHVFVSYCNQMENMGTFFSLEDSVKFAIDRVLESRTGHLDLFLRFLMGISLEKNQKLLQGFMNHTGCTSRNFMETPLYIKQLNREDLSPERCINLVHCLLEKNDRSIYEDIQIFKKIPNGATKKSSSALKDFKGQLSPAHCSALAHMLLMSEEILDELVLKKYSASDEGRRRLIPAMSCCRKAQFVGCKLNKTSCETVKRCLQSANSLIHLDLSCNPLEDSGVEILYAGLTSLHCKLQTLRLSDCKLSDESCKTVATVLQSPNALIELDLSHNDLGDSGAQILSKGLSHQKCKLQILRLSGCLISEKGCGSLVSALTSNPSHLKELDLSFNYPGESGRKLLSARLEDSKCKLGTPNMDHCAEIRLRPSVQKYACELTLDPNTAHKCLFLFEGNKKVTSAGKWQPYPDHPDRFGCWSQVLCREGLSGRCYWEAEWSSGGGHVAVTHKSIKRKGRNDDSRLGRNAVSWSLYCSPGKYTARHINELIDIPAPGASLASSRVGVYLDWPAGTLSFYSVSSDALTHLHTFHSTFTGPLYPGFLVYEDSSVFLC